MYFPISSNKQNTVPSPLPGSQLRIARKLLEGCVSNFYTHKHPREGAKYRVGKQMARNIAFGFHGMCRFTVCARSSRSRPAFILSEILTEPTL